MQRHLDDRERGEVVAEDQVHATRRRIAISTWQAGPASTRTPAFHGSIHGLKSEADR